MHRSERSWAREEFGYVALGDERRTARLVDIGAAVARCPAGKVAEVFKKDADRQGAYDFLESRHVSASAIEAAVGTACAERASKEAFAFVALDGSSLTLTDRTGNKGFGVVGPNETHGLKAVTAYALDPHGVPLGVAAQCYWARPARPPRPRNQQKAESARKGDDEKELRHWVDVIEASCARFDGVGAKAWYVADREADARTILSAVAARQGHRFTIRSSTNRRVLIEGRERAWLRPTLRRRRVFAKYAIDVTAGPRRSARTAIMHMRVAEVVLRIQRGNAGKVEMLRVTAVSVREHGTAPLNEAPLDWMLFTNAPMNTADDAVQVLKSYAFRWRIEELHKTWKSGGCNVEQTQLRSKNAVMKWATVLIAVAARAERLKLLSREDPNAPASVDLSKHELRALIILKRQNKKRTETISDEMPTIAQATLWLAELGGYTGKSSGGPPGAITIGRGLAYVLPAAAVLQELDEEKKRARG